MIKRIVKMTFKPEFTEKFELIFDQKKEKIRACSGCHSLELVREKKAAVYFTISQWKSEEDLQNYRDSILFESTWAEVKQLFDAKPEAWSTENVAFLP